MAGIKDYVKVAMNLTNCPEEIEQLNLSGGKNADNKEDSKKHRR